MDINYCCLLIKRTSTKYQSICNTHWSQVSFQGDNMSFQKYHPKEGFPGGSDSKESACNVGDLGSIPRLWRSPGGHGNHPQHSCLEESPWTEKPWVHGGHKELDTTKWQSTAPHHSKEPLLGPEQPLAQARNTHLYTAFREAKPLLNHSSQLPDPPALLTKYILCSEKNEEQQFTALITLQM